MSYLILAAAHDETAIRVASLLRARHGVARVHIRTLDEVALAPGWDHRLVDGAVESRVRLHDGTIIASHDLSAIFNRACWFDPPHFAGASAADREYARMETFALLLSWLAAARCTVLNPPAPSGLAGGVRRPLAWQALARTVGLDVLDLGATTSIRRFPSWRETLRPDLSWAARGAPDTFGNGFGWSSMAVPGPRLSALVVGERVFGDIPAHLRGPCRELARGGGLGLARVEFAASEKAPSGFIFIGGEACPEVGDASAISAIVDALDVAQRGEGVHA